MPLSPGSRLGVYEIQSSLGVGGMGEVYRARDTKLGRDVAVKILPDAFMQDPDRLARFKREALVLASLNHPNIATIFGVEDTNGVDALVLEVVEGPTLADRIAEGRLPLDEALPIARQIAAALEEAHDHGIVHRDLKPANIKLRADGTVKVLDFGLAKLAEPEPRGGVSAVTHSPTITSPAMTAAGIILGTAAYMSPEQAKAQAADKRSDVWAFGCVLYEMLTGTRAFAGDDISDTLAAVLRGTPDWNALPTETPATVRALLQRCLEKDRRRRIADVSAIRFVLDEPQLTTPAGAAAAGVTTEHTMWRRLVPVVAAAIVAAVATGVAVWMFKSAPAATPRITRFSHAVEETLSFNSVGVPSIAISPDGSMIAYAVEVPSDSPGDYRSRLQLRSMTDTVARPIQGTDLDGVIGAPVFSPDNQSIAFYVGPWTRGAFPNVKGLLKQISVNGGTAVTLSAIDLPFGMSWSGDSILIGQGPKGIVRVSKNGGEPEQIVAVNEGELAQGPQLLPGGEAILFTVARGILATPPGVTDDAWDMGEVVVQSLTSKNRKTVIKGGSDARYLPDGRLVYAVSGTLRGARFDPERLQAIEKSSPLVEGVARTRLGPINRTGAAHFSVADTGTLAYLPGPVSPNSTLRHIAYVTKNGPVELLKLAPANYEWPQVSPDAKQLAVVISGEKSAEVWIYDLSQAGSIRQLTSGGRNRFPVWSGDGQSIAFQSDRDGDLAIFTQRADGRLAAIRLTTPQRGTAHIPNSWSPNNEELLFDEVQTDSRNQLWVASLRSRRVSPFGGVSGPTRSFAEFSPNGRWVAYQSGESGINQRIFIQPVPPSGVPFPVVALGAQPRWSPDGKQLFYQVTGEMFSVSLNTEPILSAGKPEPVFPQMTRGYGQVVPLPMRDRFLGLVNETPVATAAARRIEVVLNWVEELKARVPLASR